MWLNHYLRLQRASNRGVEPQSESVGPIHVARAKGENLDGF
jgi:hypothetical protein